jgi:hypothetical protein
VSRIPLFERETRVAGGNALGLSLEERDESTREVMAERVKVKEKIL